MSIKIAEGSLIEICLTLQNDQRVISTKVEQSDYKSIIVSQFLPKVFIGTKAINVPSTLLAVVNENVYSWDIEIVEVKERTCRVVLLGEPIKVNRRATFRLNVVEQCKLVSDNKAKCVLLNVSAHGLYISTEREFNVGTQFAVRLPESFKDFNVDVEVVRRERKGIQNNYGVKLMRDYDLFSCMMELQRKQLQNKNRITYKRF